MDLSRADRGDDREAPHSTAASPEPETAEVAGREFLGAFTRVALQSFGGPAGQIAVMHRVLVEEKRWLSEERFLAALGYCMLLPGPEAQQLATYAGLLLRGTRGALVAGTLFVLPGFLSILALTLLFVLHGELPAVRGLFLGLQAAVLAIVLQALLRIGGRVLRAPPLWCIAALAFLGIALLALPFPAIVLGAGLVGLAGARLAPRAFLAAGAHGPSREPAPALAPRARLREVEPSAARALRLLGAFALLWFGPLGLLALWRGADDVLVALGLFFSKVAVVTFGGAYAVLAYVAEAAVEQHAWLLPGEMITGLGMAETTPGPLIQVVQFVGFLGAWRSPGALSPMVAGLLGACITTWVTFVPCFLWILLGAPHVESLRRSAHARAALSAITAAVVGVIANLALWFALHALFGSVSQRSLGPVRLSWPDPGSLQILTLALASLACALLFGLRRGTPFTLAICALLGALTQAMWV